MKPARRKRLLAGLVVGLSLPTRVFGQTDSAEGVHKLLDSVETANARRDVAALPRFYDDDLLFLFLPDGQDGVLAAAKQNLIEGSPKWWQESGLESFRFVGRDISVQGDVAWMRLTTATRSRGRNYSVGRFFEVAIRRGGGWRFCFWMPAFARPVALITGIKEGGQAAGVGLQTGDVIVSYAGKRVISVSDVKQLAESHAKDDRQTRLPLLVVRQNRQHRFELRPGPVGVGLADRLLPEGHAVLVDAGAPHPIKDEWQRELDAWKAAHLDGYVERFICPAGFFSLAVEKSKPMRVLTRANVMPSVRTGYDDLREKWRLETVEMRDARLIVDGDIALASSRYVAESRKETEGTITIPTGLRVYVRLEGKWWLTAGLPAPVDIGTWVPGK